MIKACVIGWPIKHSRSPLIHNYWLEKLHIEGRYEQQEVEPGNLAVFLKNLDENGYAGCNVTLPHKEAAVSLVDFPDQSVKAIGALNTIYRLGGKLYAESTDGEGFLQNLLALQPNFNFSHKTVCILGAGGSARAIIERLIRANVKKINVVNRTIARALDLESSFAPLVKGYTQDQMADACKACDVLINTTSQGMTGQPELQFDLALLPISAIVCDIVYVPLKTDLIKRAQARGHRVVPGLGMLLHQAVRGFELWFGQKPVVTSELFTLVAQDIDPDYRP
jgi:shikimate dehydrogenase